MEDFLYLIEKRKNEFSKGQKKIAEFITSNYDKAVYMTAAELGKKTGVSESTVVRFATMLGFDGYPELQSAIKKVAKENLSATKRLEVASSLFSKEKKSVLKYIMQSDSSRILNSLNKIDEKVFNQVINELIQAKKVYVLASRSSGVLGDFLCYHLNLMLNQVINVNLNNNSDVFSSLFRIEEEDVCLCFSFPRYGQKTIKAMSYAQGKNATTIAITDNAESPVAKISKFFLIADCDMLSIVDSLVAAMSLVNAILVAISVEKEIAVKKNYDTLEKLWNEENIYSKTHKSSEEEN